MQNAPRIFARLLGTIADHLDVPISLYEKASARHASLGKWLCRENSTLAQFDPDIRPQGSFRYGTVIRPLNEDEEYDLDNVCLLKNLSKTSLTQEQLKQMYGEEIKAYAKANGMLAPAEEHNRCWRLEYADEVPFHLDTLPCVPECHDVINGLLLAGVPQALASCAVAITDRRDPQYRASTSRWPSSNPRGFARFFESQARLGRSKAVMEGMRAEVENVPPYEWKTPLQRTIQLLKRHRDVMFKDSRELAPISMIITNLAARAYTGETDIESALANILSRMPALVSSVPPRVPNPANPAEDYADKWNRDPRLQRNFQTWLIAAKTDFEKISRGIHEGAVDGIVQQVLMTELTADELRSFERRTAPAVIVAPTASQALHYAPKPWGN